jgi:hypothetical protein
MANGTVFETLSRPAAQINSDTVVKDKLRRQIRVDDS